MSMTRNEAEKIAFAPIGSHAAVSLDLAAHVLRAEAMGRDAAAYAQLADCKAALQRAGIRLNADQVEA